MALFAIADLHLSFALPKPMDRFGPQWAGHAATIAAATAGRADFLMAFPPLWALSVVTAARSPLFPASARGGLGRRG